MPYRNNGSEGERGAAVGPRRVESMPGCRAEKSLVGGNQKSDRTFCPRASARSCLARECDSEVSAGRPLSGYEKPHWSVGVPQRDLMAFVLVKYTPGSFLSRVCAGGLTRLIKAVSHLSAVGTPDHPGSDVTLQRGFCRFAYLSNRALSEYASVRPVPRDP